MKGAIFDMDGLMFDTERLYKQAWRAAGKEMGIDITDEFHRAVCGTSGEEMVRIIRAYYPDCDPDPLWRRCYAICLQMQREFLPEKPYLHEILYTSKEIGLRLAVASSTAPELVRENLSTAGVDGYFDAVVSGLQVAHGKPAPDIFLFASEKLGLDPKDCYVLEDSFNGVRSGYAAGCRTIMIPDLVQPTPEIRSMCTAV